MKSFCLALCLFFVLRCCSGQTIYDQLTVLNATTFKSLVDQAGLAQMLSSAGPWTVLVPTNAAFAKIPPQDLSAVTNNTGVATDVIKYHMLQGRYNSYSFMFIKHYRYNSTNGHVLRIHRSANGLFFNQAKAVKSNINATNGMVFLINTVLDVPEGTVTEILANPSYNISKFLQIVRTAKLDQHYNNRVTLNRYTMFAPNDAAVDAIPAAERTRIDSDSVYAQLFVEYHVHSGTLHASSVAKRRSISTTYPGKSITVNLLAGGMKLNNVAQILYPDIEADNGIVHIISHALTPPPDSSIIG